MVLLYFGWKIWDWSANWSIYFPSFWLPLAFSGQFGCVVVNSEDFIASASTTASVSSSTKYKVSHFDKQSFQNLFWKSGKKLWQNYTMIWNRFKISNENQNINLLCINFFFSDHFQTLGSSSPFLKDLWQQRVCSGGGWSENKTTKSAIFSQNISSIFHHDIFTNLLN